jgi:hypothetical protein
MFDPALRAEAINAGCNVQCVAVGERSVQYAVTMEARTAIRRFDTRVCHAALSTGHVAAICSGDTRPPRSEQRRTRPAPYAFSRHRGEVSTRYARRTTCS